MDEDKVALSSPKPLHTFLSVKIEAVEQILRKTHSDKSRCPEQLLYKDKDKIRTHTGHVCIRPSSVFISLYN